MTSKRKRRRARGRISTSAQPVPADAAGGSPEEGTAESDVSSETDRPKETGRRGFAAVPSPYPPFVESVGAGLRAAGASPPVLAVAFLGELAMWGLFQALEAPTPAGALAGLMGLPPVHLVFEVPVARSLASAAAQVGVLLAVVAVRAVILGLLCLLLVDVLRRGSADVRTTFRRLPRVWAAMAQFYVLEVALVLVAPLVLGLLGAQFVGLGTILIIIAALQFLIMAPIAIAAEDGPAPEAIRWSVRAARLPGLRHFGLVLTYFFLSFSVLIPASGFGLQPATPSILVWAFALVATFLHTAVLGAFAYRWLAVREEPAIRQARANGAAGSRSRTASRSRTGSTSGTASKPATAVKGRSKRRR